MSFEKRNNFFYSKGDVGYAIDMSQSGTIQPRVFDRKHKDSEKNSGMIEINKNAAKEKNESAGVKA